MVQVFTQPDRPAGRGKKLTPTPVGALASELHLELKKTADINSETLPPADLMVVIAFGQKIGHDAVNDPALGSVNLHSSRLPRYRGAAPINWAILNGDANTGNSIIRLADKMDAGAILAQSTLEIGPTETAGELHDRLALDGAPLMLNLIEQLRSNTAVEIEQDHSRATSAPKLSRQTAQIDWTRAADVIVHQINGLSPWPGCRVRLLDGDAEIAVITLIRAGPSPAASSAEPGTLTADGSVVVGDGQTIQILEMQPQGKRAMSLDAFRNGRPWKSGMKLVSLLPFDA